MPTVAGILTIIAGAIGIIGGITAIVFRGFFGPMTWFYGGHLRGLFVAIGLLALIIGIIEIIGGISTLHRRSWGFALASAILAVFPAWPLGVTAIIFVALSKKEFNNQAIS